MPATSTKRDGEGEGRVKSCSSMHLHVIPLRELQKGLVIKCTGTVQTQRLGTQKKPVVQA